MTSRLGHLQTLFDNLVRCTNSGLGAASLIEGNDYETCQRSLLYVIVLFFGLDPAQNTIVVYSELRN